MRFSLKKFSPPCREVLASAVRLAMELAAFEVRPEFLLACLAQRPDTVAGTMLKNRRFKITPIKNNDGEIITPSLSDNTLKIIEDAMLLAKNLKSRSIATEHLLLSLITCGDKETTMLLKKSGLSPAKLSKNLKKAIEARAEMENEIINPGADFSESEIVPLPEEQSAPLKKSLLEKYSTDLCAQAHKLDKISCRENEITALAEVLTRRNKNNAILVGEAGVGKTAVAEGFAKALRAGRFPSLKGKKVFALDLSALIAGTMYRGEFEGRMRDLLNEIKGRSDVILFIDEIHNMVGAGSTQGSMDVANLLKPALARGELRLIGATTYAEYKKNILSDSALDRRFQNILIVEPDNEQTLKILRGQKNRLEKHYQLMITPQAIETAVLLSQRFIHDRKQPDKALDLLDRACASQLVNGKQKIIKPEHVAQLLAKAFGQKAEDILNASGNRLEKLSAKLNNEIIGQTQAIENICKILRRNQLGLSSSTGPVASLIFCGPSGSGKTFCAQALAKEYFLDKDALIKIDMSEFGEKHSISRLIGAPAGYVGYREASVLVDGLRKRPTSVVLFDEIEKAHPDIFNILLQILDSGYLTDGSGEKINFQNAIIVMTTNCGGQNNKSMGFEKEASTDYYKDELKKFLRPEILNRLDALVPFVTLNENDLKIIADDYLKKIRTSAGKFKILSSDLDIAIANSQKEGGVRALIRKLSDLAEKELTK